uniref:IS110 family transposase n=1 Tax=Globodera pallida TaxID=36090 RepID=A0A183CSR4_GLOPA
RGTEEIRQLLSVKRNVPNRRDLAEQMNRLVGWLVCCVPTEELCLTDHCLALI